MWRILRKILENKYRKLTLWKILSGNWKLTPFVGRLLSYVPECRKKSKLNCVKAKMFFSPFTRKAAENAVLFPHLYQLVKVFIFSFDWHDSCCKIFSWDITRILWSCLKAELRWHLGAASETAHWQEAHH